MRRTAPILLTAALALGAVAADTPEDISDHPCYDAEDDALAYPEQQVWFHEGDGKAGNLDENPAPWDTTPPTTSVTGGAGAGATTPGVATLGEGTPAEQHAVFSGSFTGCLDTVLLDVYSFDASNRTGHGGVVGAPDGCLPDCVPDAQPAEMDVGLTVTVDGYDVYTAGPLQITTEFDYEGFGPNLNRVVVNLRESMEQLADFGYTSLEGEHEVTVSIRSWYVNTGHSMFVWDTSEVPSGVTFNTDAPEGVVVAN